ncbi:MAG: winged helix-turn-helix transcriptional regulator [Candidatus Pacebacteria bacterium]|nr:winged helix-turn-helix transcriptional regulator [Candidatus Paceibacterota bacterium]
MNYLLLIIVAVAGIALGLYIARKKSGNLLPTQTKAKIRNKEDILEFLHTNKRITNNEVEKLLSVSDATATRYLDELENQRKIEQIGTTGHAVYYILK